MTWGFSVAPVSDGSEGWEGKAWRKPGWRVQLPHMCSNWMIAGDENADGATHEEAETALRSFLAEGAEALAALGARQPYGEPDPAIRHN